MQKVFFITGASKGFGYVWTKYLLEAGHKVVATSRNTDPLNALQAEYPSQLLALSLDVTDREMCFQCVEKTLDIFGRVDVLISNAGYGHFGFIEESNEQQVRNQMETNLFGSIWIIQAVLPVMRQQNTGHIMQVSSIGGVMAFPNLGIYHASKWAVEGLCESLSQEVAGFNIKVTLIEPGPYKTDWSQASAIRSDKMDEYDEVRASFVNNTKTFDRGSPEATGKTILALAEMSSPPLRLMLGRMAWTVIEPAYKKRLEEWKTHLEMSNQAHED